MEMINLTWDKYFLNIVNSVSSNSKCLSRQIGAVIVRDEKYIISTGYNGPPIGCSHCSDIQYRDWLLKRAVLDGIECRLEGIEENTICPRRFMGFKSSEGMEYCQAAHAERNAIDIAARLGHSIEGCSMYLNCLIPCVECAKSIVNAGIREVVVTELVDYERKGITGREILQKSYVQIRKYGNDEK